MNHPGTICKHGLTAGFTEVLQCSTDFYSYFLFLLR